MAGLSEDLIALTELKFVQQCSDLLRSPQSRNNIIAASLLGIYCGALIYRSYKDYVAKQEAARQTETLQAEVDEIPINQQTTFTSDAPTTVESPEVPLASESEPALVEQHSAESTLIATP